MRPVYRRGQALVQAAAARVVGRGVRTRVADVRDPRPKLHVLHIGKTGGTALKHALGEYEDSASFHLLFRGHDVTLAQVPKGERFMFVLRDPLDRFVSAFNGRFREDRPRYHYPWREQEREAFAIFRTPDELACALSSDNLVERASAERAMHGIGHVNTPYSFWFESRTAFEARLPDLFFIGLLDSLDDDFALLRRKLGLPESAHLPVDETVRHETPYGFDTRLGDEAKANLGRWYAWDVAFVEHCRELASAVNVRV